MASTYRVFLFNERALLLGHAEYDAPWPEAAKMVGASICQACDDECTAYEIWVGASKLVMGLRHANLPSVHDLADRLGSSACEGEEQLAASNWAIAQSGKLLGTLRRFKAHRAVLAASHSASTKVPPRR